MGLSTMSAARIYKGQLAGGSGEESVLAMETFPHMALAKVSGAVLGGHSCCPCLKPHAPLSLPDLHHRPAGARQRWHGHRLPLWGEGQCQDSGTKWGSCLWKMPQHLWQ